MVNALFFGFQRQRTLVIGANGFEMRRVGELLPANVFHVSAFQFVDLALRDERDTFVCFVCELERDGIYQMFLFELQLLFECVLFAFAF